MQNELLLIVDVQVGFVSERTRHVVPRLQELLSSNRFENIAFTQFMNMDESPYEQFMNWYRLKSQEEQEIIEELKPFATKVFKKDIYTAVNNEFKNYIKEKGIDKIYIAGIDTDCCVLSSATDIFQVDIQPIVLAYYCASNGGAASHDAALLVLRRVIGEKQINLGSIVR